MLEGTGGPCRVAGAARVSSAHALLTNQPLELLAMVLIVGVMHRMPSASPPSSVACRHVASTQESMQLQRRKTIEATSLASAKAGRVSCISRADSGLEDHAGMQEQTNLEAPGAIAAELRETVSSAVSSAGTDGVPRPRAASNPGLTQQPGTRSAPAIGAAPAYTDEQAATYQPTAAWAPASDVSVGTAFGNIDDADADHYSQAASHGARPSASQRRQIFGMGGS